MEKVTCKLSKVYDNQHFAYMGSEYKRIRIAGDQFDRKTNSVIDSDDVICRNLTNGKKVEYLSKDTEVLKFVRKYTLELSEDDICQLTRDNKIAWDSREIDIWSKAHEIEED